MTGTDLSGLDRRRAQEFRVADVRLVALICQALDAWPIGQAVVTSLHRTAEEDARLGGSGVHVAGPPWRAVDMIGRGMGWPEYLEVAERLNADWVYNPTAPEKQVAVAQTHGTGPHLHLQVHPQTVRRETTCALPTETTSTG